MDRTMKRILLALLLVLTPQLALAQSVVGPTNAILCNKTATFAGLAANTVLVPVVSGQIVVVCGWHVTTSSGTSVTFSLATGTQTTNPCDTGTKSITPALSVTSSAPSADHIDFAIASSAAGQALCVTPSSNTISGLVYYSQF